MKYCAYRVLDNSQKEVTLQYAIMSDPNFGKVAVNADITTTATTQLATIVWKKFIVGYFHVKFVHGEIFVPWNLQ